MAIPRDDDTFEAALSLLDDCVFGEAGDDSLPSLYADSPPTRERAKSSNTADKPRRQAEYNEKRRLLRKAGVYGDPNRARNARKKEAADLRELVERLHLDLKVLRSRHISVTHQQSSRAVVSTPGIPNKWQEIARIQRRRRNEAEHYNIRLKHALGSQQEVANKLFGLLRKRATQLANEYSSLMNLVCAKNYMVDVLDFRGDTGTFQELLCRLDVAYRALDTVFTTNGLSNLTATPCDIHIREGVEGKYLEFFSYKVLPFDVRETTDAAWNHFKGVEKHLGNGSIYKKAEKDLDEPYTIVADFTKEVYSNDARADIKVKQIVRRFVEPGRDIVLWVARAKPAEIKHKMLRGLTYRSRGYAVTQRFPDSPPDRDLSVLKQCSRISLDHEVDTRYSPEDVRTLTTFLIANAAQNMRVHRQLIENALIERGRTNWSL
ncbi:hypothetical protein F442_14268 [Phytophthora nicotianae P10297]|uniref:M96 mating-specific protein family n=1 Tax=Phytophthora nicotianae P10297 TaxID=1317064 RepID=W2YT72_PHYNI|nr:hypothetical protein F442_14268 [Phytophthora nicotianae P10297]